jgi:hypothetical protein
MKVLCYWASAGLLAVATTAARAGEEVLTAGDPPLTRATADRKIDYWEWVFELRVDDRHRAELRRLQAEEWGRREAEWKERWANFLAAWRDAVAAAGVDAVRLRLACRRAAVDGMTRGETDVVGQWLLTRQAPAAPAMGAGAAVGMGMPSRPGDAEALKLAMLRLQFDQRQRFLRDLSRVQAEHHETMMLIIRNIGPSGRYEYNPSSGRYDRWVPNP